MTAAHQCLDDNAATQYVQNVLPLAGRERIEMHLDQCPECLALVVALARQTDPSDKLGVDESGRHARLSLPLQRGAFLGRYTMLGVVGAGAIGVVYAAYDSQLDRKVALKFWRPRQLSRLLSSDSEHRRTPSGLPLASLDLREARMMARLNHPNVVTVHDAGEVDGRVFLAMEYVDGSSIAAWLHERDRNWREVLDVFLQAGQGLAAAHAAGLVHRDFKPDNVLLTSAGRVAVTDFGLARPSETIVDGESNHDVANLRWTGTSTGNLAGTPAYMAPEVFDGKAADARSDQFSFAVALYEGLYGDLPRKTPRESAVPDRLRDRPRGIPLWLRRVLLKSLSWEPADRFLSMEDLLEALRADPSKKRGKIAWASAATCMALSSVIGVRHSLHKQSLVCKGAEKKLLGIWDDGRKAEIHAAFLKTGVPYAQDAWRGVEKTLDAYASTWTDAHLDACEATRVRGEQSAELMDLRMTCLSDELRDFDAFSRVLSRADAKMIPNAATGAELLPDVNACKDVRSLQEIEPLPSDPNMRARIDAAGRELSQADALYAAGQYREGLPLATRVLQEATTIGYAPLEAKTLNTAGSFEHRAGTWGASTSLLQRAVLVADQARDDRTRARSLVELMKVDVNSVNQERALQWNNQAQAVISRTSGNTDLECERLATLIMAFGITNDIKGARDAAEQGTAACQKASKQSLMTFLSAVATLQDGEGDPRGAIDTLRRLLALAEDELGMLHPRVANAYSDLGLYYADIDQFSEAIRYGERALQAATVSLGPDNYFTATYEATLADSFLLAKREPARALNLLEHSISIQERDVGRASPKLTDPLRTLADAYFANGRCEGAERTVERAESIDQDPDFVIRARLELTAAKIALVCKRDKKLAQKLAGKAWAEADEDLGKRRISDWLRENGLPAVAETKTTN